MPEVGPGQQLLRERRQLHAGTLRRLACHVMRHVIDRLDHQMINEIEPFTVINPSAENLAKYFYDESNTRLNSVTKGRVRVKDVTVFETDTTTAKYSE